MTICIKAAGPAERDVMTEMVCTCCSLVTFVIGDEVDVVPTPAALPYLGVGLLHPLHRLKHHVGGLHDPLACARLADRVSGR